MNCEFIVSGMTWSYSRLTTYEQCPYKFFLTYIMPQDKTPQFFSSYGSFVHDFLAKFYTNKIAKENLSSYYIAHFLRSVEGKAPNAEVYTSFFRQGIDAMERMEYFPEEKEIIAVEKRYEFSFDGIQMQGIIDLLVRDADGIHIIDHKSHKLKHRSRRAKPTKGDEELDRYLRQLYLYSIPVYEQYGVYPKDLTFHCYRTGEWITEPFSIDALESAKKWAIETVEKIKQEEDWNPSPDYQTCRMLCDVFKSCEFS